jgi:hypothetical protein
VLLSKRCLEQQHPYPSLQNVCFHCIPLWLAFFALFVVCVTLQSPMYASAMAGVEVVALFFGALSKTGIMLGAHAVAALLL